MRALLAVLTILSAVAIAWYVEYATQRHDFTRNRAAIIERAINEPKPPPATKIPPNPLVPRR